MKKIGVFLGFQPGDHLTIHGIGRLVAFVLQGDNAKNMVLFYPKWLDNELHNLLKDNKIDIKNLELVSTEAVPVGVKLKNILNKDKVKTKKINFFFNFKKKLVKTIKLITTDFFSTSYGLLFYLKTLIYLMIFILLLPLIIGTFVLLGFYKILRIIGKYFYSGLKKSIPENYIFRAISIFKSARGKIYQIVIDNELLKLAKMVNRRKDIDVCFIPSMVWPQIESIKCKKVLAAPDIVFYDFPTQFKGVGEIHERLRKSIEHGDSLITYSEYVKNKHLIEKCGVDQSRVTVIKHANVDMSVFLRVPKSTEGSITPLNYAKQILSEYINSNYGPNHILFNYDIQKFDCVIFSSQYRPHKNIFNLIKAIRIANREFNRDIKLILTGDVLKQDVIKNFILTNNMENEIIVMHNISSQLLAALNTLVKCSVNPTLFEGGFPFTFSEAYSVGTPSVMSEIPVVLAEIDSIDLRKKMLFDPYNPYSIAEKIVWAVDNASELYKEQEVLYHQFSNRDWKAVATEYHKVFNQLVG
ncbi:glycosyltransferase [Paenibacillus lautus]|uniref:glycosyltransferase n=1 Tax=Paenibacillus lautus TaxID=1401 RepID=UPI003D296C82